MEEGRQYRMNPEVFQAASTGDSSLKLADSNSSTFLQVTIGKNTVLHVALQFKKIDAAKDIVNLCPRLVYETNSKGNTPLHVAASVGDSSMVKLLIDQAKKLDVETGGQQQLLSMVNQDGDTALHVAVRYGNFEVVEELIKEKDPAELAKQVNYAGESALFLAVERQHYRIASHILRNAPDCSYAGRHGMNVLHALVINTTIYSNKGDSVFQTLRGIDKYEKTESRSRRAILTLLWMINMLFLIRLPKIFEDDSKKKDKIQDLIIGLRTVGTIPRDIVKAVMEKWPSTIEQHDESGWTPLHIAAHLGDAQFVKLLLTKGNSPAYVRNKEGLSALHIAAKEGNQEVMKELMEACPDIYELLDNKGRNALHVAAESESWPALFFFDNRPEFEGLVNEQDGEGNTPSNLAAINGNTDMAQYLGKGGDIVLNATNKEGFTTMDNVLLTSKLHSWGAKKLWEMSAGLSLRGALLKMGIQNLDPRKKTKLAGDGDEDGSGDGSGDGDGDGDCNGNGNGKERSKSDFLKQVREGNMLVATLIATVTFTAALTVPGGFNQNGNVGEGLAVLSKITAFRVFLIANTLAFGLSTTSVFVHFLASTTSEEVTFHRKLERRTAFYTNWSIGAMLVAFIAGTYTVVPHSLGITVAILLSCCFLSSLFLPLTIRSTDFAQ